jgi:single-strand DNA-binding protein
LAGINSVALVGRLTRNPELRYTSSGTAVTNFTLAVDRPYKNEDGSNDADFPQVICWKALAETVANHMKKGRLVGVEGRIQTRSFEGNDGKKNYVTEILAENVRFLDRAPSSENENQSNSGTNNSNTSNSGNRGNGGGNRSSGNRGNGANRNSGNRNF